MSIDRQFREAIIEAERNLADPTFAAAFNVDIDLTDVAGEVVEIWRECHARRYATDLLLQGLGWQVTGAGLGGEIEIEVGVKSVDRETRRWMDYLGYERECENPLLMVESKRPRAHLPRTPNHTGYANRHPLGAIIRAYVSLRGTPGPDLRSAQTELGKVWVEYIDTHVDYLNSIRNAGSQLPKRTVITNGIWIVLFGTPADLLHSGVGDAEILIYSDFDVIKQEQSAEEIFEYLAYRNLCKFPFQIREKEIATFIDPSKVQKAALGVHLSYSVHSGLYKAKPYVRAAPLVFLQAENGAVSSIMSSNDMEIDAGQYLDHEQFCRNSQSLYEATCGMLGKNVPLVSCEEFLSSTSIPPVWRAGSDSSGDRHVLITGEHPYFLVPDDRHAGCPGHLRAGSGVKWALESHSLPSTDPQKTMFIDGDPALCGHKDLEVIRMASPQDAPSDNSKWTRSEGPRCHLLDFEEYACCRSCCYIDICSKDSGFCLPCGENGLVSADGR